MDRPAYTLPATLWSAPPAVRQLLFSTAISRGSGQPQPPESLSGASGTATGVLYVYAVIRRSRRVQGRRRRPVQPGHHGAVRDPARGHRRRARRSRRPRSLPHRLGQDARLRNPAGRPHRGRGAPSGGPDPGADSRARNPDRRRAAPDRPRPRTARSPPSTAASACSSRRNGRPRAHHRRHPRPA